MTAPPCSREANLSATGINTDTTPHFATALDLQNLIPQWSPPKQKKRCPPPSWDAGRIRKLATFRTDRPTSRLETGHPVSRLAPTKDTNLPVSSGKDNAFVATSMDSMEKEIKRRSA